MSNETKKFAGLEALQTFLNKCKELFANITHKHTLSEIEDYTVDTELSSTSENTVQIKVVNAEFDSIAEGMAALELAIDGKVDKVHSHEISDITNLQTSLDSKADANSVVYIDENDNETVILSEDIQAIAELVGGDA